MSRRRQIYQTVWPACLAGLVVLLLSNGPIRAQDDAAESESEAESGLETLAYTLRFDISGPDGDLKDTLRKASDLARERRQGAPGAPGLIALAQGDYRNFLAVLYARGHYSGTISIRLAGAEASSYDFATDLPASPAVVVKIVPGPVFRFGRIGFADPQPPADTEIPEDFRSGRRASAGVVIDAETAALEAWRNAGYPKVKLLDQVTIADHKTTTLDVSIRIAPGPKATFGPVDVKGAKQVDPEFMRYMADIPVGKRYDPEDIKRASAQLNRLRVFRSVQVKEAEEVNADGSLPITLQTTPRLPRRYGFGATASTTEGIGLEGFWLHRNLRGKAERLRFDASINGIGTESTAGDYDYAVGVSYLMPGWLDPDTDLETEFGLEQNVFETYTERKARARIALERQFSAKLRGEVGTELTYSEVEDDLGNRSFITASLPVKVAYDRRDDPLDPREGYYIEGELRPFYELEFQNAATRASIELRRYFPVFGEDTVIAMRGGVGTVFGGTLTELPPDLLFFTGGGGSIRGFEFRSIGLDRGGDTVGGRSKVEFSAEVRHQLNERYGLAAFVDGGAVSENALPGAGSDWRYGVGVGGRIYTALGPIRLDVAVPLDQRGNEPSFALYIGIGQAY